MADIVDETLIPGAVVESGDDIVVADSSVRAEPSGVGSGDAERLCDAVEGEVANVLNESARLDAFYEANPNSERLPEDICAILEKLSGTERYQIDVDGIRQMFSVFRDLNGGVENDDDFYYHVVVVPLFRGRGGVFDSYVAQNGKWVSKIGFKESLEERCDFLRKLDVAVDAGEYNASDHFSTHSDFEEVPEDLLAMIDRLEYGNTGGITIDNCRCTVSVKRESSPLLKPGTARPCVSVNIAPAILGDGEVRISFNLIDGCLSKKGSRASAEEICEVMEKVVASLDSKNRERRCRSSLEV